MKRVLFLLIIVSVMMACQNEEPIDTVTNVTPIVNLPTDPVDGSVSGLITDANGPLADAEVEIMGQFMTTDSEGFFSFENVELDQQGTLVKASLTNYFDGSRVFYPNQENDNFIQVKLHQPIVESIQSSNGGLVQIQEATVILPSGNYITNVNTYSGEITTKGLLLDPTRSDFSLSMPGDLRGISEDGELVSLQPYGVLKLSLEDNLGESLDLPMGTKAELNLPIESSLLDNAPQTIPLFFYHAETGVWIQDGFADKQNAFYHAEVDHFTFWATANTFDIVEISGQVRVNGNLTSNTLVSLIDEAENYTLSTVTTASGRFSVRVPRGLNLTLFTQGVCNEQPLDTLIGPLLDSKTVDIDLASTEGDVSISGYIMNCDNTAPATNAFARVVYDGVNQLVQTDADGFFETKIKGCSTEQVEIYGVDLANSTISERHRFPVDPEISAALILPCDEVASGHMINYEGMDWSDALQNSVLHNWGISTIESVDTTIIISPTISNSANPNEVFMSGAFVFVKGSTEVDYLLDFKTQGFKAGGTFVVEFQEHEDFTSYRFVGVSTEITANGNVEPSSVTIDLVYYD